jgi:RNA polymerase-binding transcription factor DksA
MDSADLASEEVERRLNMTLSERGRGRINEIDHALRRIDEANYGICEECGLEVAEERLKAMPFTRHCWDCQRDQERAAKTSHRGADSEQELFEQFGSIPAEDGINPGTDAEGGE